MPSELQDDYLKIDTPENVVFGYKVAGIGSRFLAALVDTLIIVVLQLLTFLTFALILGSLFRSGLLNRPASIGGSSGDIDVLFAWGAAIVGLISFAFFWGYYILFEMIWNGQSPGKRWMGLRVIKTDGTPITLAESIIRNLVRLVDFLPASYGVGVVAMFIDPQSRRLGDLAAGTLVVFDRAEIALESLSAKPTAHIAPGSAVGAVVTTFALERLTTHEIQMAEDFLRRRNELANRSALAEKILLVLLEKMGASPSQASGWHPENLIAAIAQASRNRTSSPPVSDQLPRP